MHFKLPNVVNPPSSLGKIGKGQPHANVAGVESGNFLQTVPERSIVPSKPIVPVWNPRPSPPGTAPAGLPRNKPNRCDRRQPESPPASARVGTARSAGSANEARVREAAGIDPSLLQLDHLRHYKALRIELQQLGLTEYFDERGGVRFGHLGLSFAAKQAPTVQGSFGSQLHTLSTRIERKKLPDFRTSGLRSDALFIDQCKSRLRNEEYISKLKEEARAAAAGAKSKKDLVLKRIRQPKDSLLDAHVVDRQLLLFFAEVPSFEYHLPSNVDWSDLQPLDASREEDLKERRISDRLNANLLDPHWIEGQRAGWLLEREDIVMLGHYLAMWSLMTRGSNLTIGLDRPTFARFILDVGLVDQEKVPFFWAVSLFDSVAAPLRLCSPDALWASSAPFIMYVNRWTAMGVLDIMLRQHCCSTTKTSFMASLFERASSKVPAIIRITYEETRRKAFANRKSLKATTSQVDPSMVDRPDPDRYLRNLDTDSEMRARSCLINAMLVEPEVLHAVAEHYHFFSRLQKCYADEDGHTTLPLMMQFCADFRLAPQIANDEFVKSCYKDACCLELPHDIANLLPPLPSDEDASPGLENNSSRAPSRIPSKSRSQKGTAHEIPVKFGPAAFTEVLLKLAFVYLGFYGNTVQQNSTGHARFIWLLCYLRFVLQRLSGSWTRRSGQENTDTSDDSPFGLPSHHAPDLPHERLCSVLAASNQPSAPSGAAAHNGGEDARSFRAYNALLQPHLGVGFADGERSRRPTDGTAVKQRRPRLRPSGMATTAKIMKFKTNINKAVVQRRLSAEMTPATSDSSDAEYEEYGHPCGRRTSTKEQTARNEELERAMWEKMRECKDAMPSMSLVEQCRRKSDEVPVHLRKAAKADDDLWPIEELFKVEAGQPCLQEGICVLCGDAVSPHQWGRPRCRGCSVVDAMAFESHPFKPLLMDWPSGVVPMQTEVILAPHELQVLRYELTPTPASDGDGKAKRGAIPSAGSLAGSLPEAIELKFGR